MTSYPAEHPPAELKNLRAVGVIAQILNGSSEDAVYRQAIDLAIRAARQDGLSESDVEVVASQARSDVASILAECRGLGLIPVDRERAGGSRHVHEV